MISIACMTPYVCMALNMWVVLVSKMLLARYIFPAVGHDVISVDYVHGGLLLLVQKSVGDWRAMSSIKLAMIKMRAHAAGCW